MTNPLPRPCHSLRQPTAGCLSLNGKLLESVVGRRTWERRLGKRRWIDEDLSKLLMELLYPATVLHLMSRMTMLFIGTRSHSSVAPHKPNELMCGLPANQNNHESFTLKFYTKKWAKAISPPCIPEAESGGASRTTSHQRGPNRHPSRHLHPDLCVACKTALKRLSIISLGTYKQ